jgi:hypothetical protein
MDLASRNGRQKETAISVGRSLHNAAGASSPLSRRTIFYTQAGLGHIREMVSTLVKPPLQMHGTLNGSRVAS